jgi:hypothetical protein
VLHAAGASTVRFVNATLSENLALEDGAAMMLAGTQTVELEDLLLQENAVVSVTNQSAAVLSIAGGTVSITNSSFRGNRAVESSGQAVLQLGSSAKVHINKCQFEANNASRLVVTQGASNTTITFGRFTDNYPPSQGDVAIQAEGTSTIIDSSVFRENHFKSLTYSTSAVLVRNTDVSGSACAPLGACFQSATLVACSTTLAVYPTVCSNKAGTLCSFTPTGGLTCKCKPYWTGDAVLGTCQLPAGLLQITGPAAAELVVDKPASTNQSFYFVNTGQSILSWVLAEEGNGVAGTWSLANSTVDQGQYQEITLTLPSRQVGGRTWPDCAWFAHFQGCGRAQSSFVESNLLVISK